MLREYGGLLSGHEIARQMALGNIEITSSQEGWSLDIEEVRRRPNSVDLHLADDIWYYDRDKRVQTSMHRSGSQRMKQMAIDSANIPPLIRVQRTEVAREYSVVNDRVFGYSRRQEDRFPFSLRPGFLYLGRTVERIRAEGFVPVIDGRSSAGRLGLFVHVTAGRGDDGFNGTFTLEIVVVEPLLVYPWPHELSRLIQVSFIPVVGERSPYKGRYQSQEWTTASRLDADLKKSRSR